MSTTTTLARRLARECNSRRGLVLHVWRGGIFHWTDTATLTSDPGADYLGAIPACAGGWVTEGEAQQWLETNT